MRLAPLALAALAGLLLAGCGKEPKSGACSGTEDGTYYRLEFSNFVQSSLEVRVNGRFVGNVPAAVVKNPNADPNALKPGYAQFGEFPICDKTVIDFAGVGITSQKVCSTPLLTSAACRAARPDYCWISPIPVVGGTAGIPPGSDPPQLSAPGCDDASACASSITYDASSC